MQNEVLFSPKIGVNPRLYDANKFLRELIELTILEQLNIILSVLIAITIIEKAFRKIFDNYRRFQDDTLIIYYNISGNLYQSLQVNYISARP